MSEPKTPRVAIYARFSSKLQNPTSVDDQIRMCRNRAREMRAAEVAVHADRAATGTTRHSRPALRELLLDAERGRIDIVLAEALDRLSRDQEDIAGIHKRLRYWNVELVTLQEGPIEPIHICVGGLMNQAFSENLAAKTRRGQIGAVHAGRIPTGLCYGYRLANRIEPDGTIVRGLREIHPDQAPVVRRIFTLYAEGTSARKIAARLNAEHIPGPRGRAWSFSTINGNRARRNGILNNELYIGRLLHGRQSFVRDPDTGKRQARPNPPDEWTVRPMPQLRIVDDDLWARVQQRRAAGQDRRINPVPHTPLPLTGILRCGVCGGPMTVVNGRRYSCYNRRNKGTCDNPRGIHAAGIEDEACGLLALQVVRETAIPDLIHRAAQSSRARRRELAEGIADGERRIQRLLDSIETGAQSSAAHRRILDIESDLAVKRLELRSMPPVPDATPEEFSRRIRERLDRLGRAIAQPASSERRLEALIRLAALIERIDIFPLPGRGKVEIAIAPNPDALVAFALQDTPRPDPEPAE